jgi:hypothetical protein
VTVKRPTDVVCCTNAKRLLNKFVETKLCRRRTRFRDRDACKVRPIAW